MLRELTINVDFVSIFSAGNWLTAYASAITFSLLHNVGPSSINQVIFPGAYVAFRLCLISLDFFTSHTNY